MAMAVVTMMRRRPARVGSVSTISASMIAEVTTRRPHAAREKASNSPTQRNTNMMALRSALRGGSATTDCSANSAGRMTNAP